jgi:hypothetical protein
MVRIEPREIVLAARAAGRLLRLCALGAALHLGCTLITDVDRSKIPQPPPFEPDSDAGVTPPEPELDGGVDGVGEPDAPPPLEDGGSQPVSDAAATGDAS